MIHDLDRLVARAVRLGLLINLLIPAGVAALAFGLRESGVGPQDPSLAEGPSVVFVVLVAVAVGDLVAAFLLRRRLFSPEQVRSIRHDPSQVEHWLVRASAIVFVIGASPMVCGAILYMLSGDIRHLAFFGIITLLAYRLFRPTKDLLEEVLNGSARS
jgi:hypothetical protein